MKKGTIDYDFILSIALFVIAYTSLFTLLPYINTGATDYEDSFIQEANYLSTVLAKYPGYPKNWTNTNQIESLGLSYYDNTSYYPNIIDLKKAQAITATTCKSLESKTAITDNFLISIKLNNGSEYNCTGTIKNYSREISRPIMVYNNDGNYYPGVLELYTW